MRKLSGLPFRWKDAQGYVMQLSFGLFLLLILIGQGVLAQQQPKSDLLNRKVSYEATKLPLSKVLKDLRTQMHIRFTYNSDLIRRQTPVTVKMQGVTLESLLRQVLLNTGLWFTEEMGGIIIYEAQASAEKSTDLSLIVRGMVTDPQGAPLAGVSVKGLTSKEMSITQPDGLFVLVAKQQEQISLSLVGMKTVLYTVKPTAESLILFKMDTIIRAIQEVVVNGYQKIDPRLATGSVFKLNAAEIIQPGQPSVDRMLQGKVPGMMVINNSGGVNAKPTLRIRGTSTLIGNAAPLWVIDGMVRPDPVNVSSAILNNLLNGPSQSNYDMMGNAVSGLNPYDIESITFLKDAGATSIYGTRAANGVIVVTTKRGKPGPVSLSYNTNISFQARPSYRNLNLMNSKERVAFSKSLIDDGVVYNGNMSGYDEQFSYEGLLRSLYARKITDAQFGDQVNTLQTRNTDWFKLLFRNQMSTQHSLSMSGGVGKTTYYASLSYMNLNGSAKQDGKNTYSASVGITSEMSKRLTLDLLMQSSYIKSTGYYQSVNPLTYALQTSRIYSPDDFYPMRAPGGMSITEPLKILNLPYDYNIQNEINHSENNSSTHSTSVNLNLNYKISRHWSFGSISGMVVSGADGLTAADEQTTTIAILRGWNGRMIPTREMLKQTNLPSGGMAYMVNQKSLMLSLRNNLDYNTGFFKDRDQFSFTFGNELRNETANGLLSTEPGYFPDRGKMFAPTPAGRQNYSSEIITSAVNNSVAFYSSAAYNMMNRYVISANIRTDGSNRFGQYANSRFLPNYSIAGRWNVTSENWFPATSLISNWQFTGSYGTQGNVIDVVGPNLIATYATSGGVDQITGKPFMHIKSMPYPDLRWEKTYQWNVGTQLAMFNNRFSVNLDYYSKKTVDVLDQIDIPFEYGMSQMYRNGSTLFNSGLEARINVDVIRSKQAFLNITFVTSKNINRVSDKIITNNYSSFFTGTGHLPGRPISGFYSYMYKGLSHDKGIPTFYGLDLKEKTTNPNDFLVYSGQLEPVFTGSFQPTFRYKSFSAGMMVYISLGSSKRLNNPFQQTASGNGTPAPFTNLSRSYFDRWRKPGDELITNIPAMRDSWFGDDNIKVPYQTVASNGNGTTTQIVVNPYDAYNLSDFRTVRNNYIRCNTMNFSYSIPAAKLKGTRLKNLSVGISVNNVFTIANKDLKGQDPEIAGVGQDALPITRQYTCSLNANF